MPNRPATSFSSNGEGYGAGGRLLTTPLSSTDDENGRDGGCIVEIL
jgi:hypothetical protein